MKTYIKEITTMILLLILIGCNTQNQNHEEVIRGNIMKYLSAIESGDINEIVKYSDDIRFPDKNEQRLEYEKIQDDISDTSIEKLEKISDTEYQVTIKYKQDKGQLTEIKFPVVKKEDGWRILVGRDN